MQLGWKAAVLGGCIALALGNLALLGASDATRNRARMMQGAAGAEVVIYLLATRYIEPALSSGWQQPARRGIEVGLRALRYGTLAYLPITRLSGLLAAFPHAADPNPLLAASVTCFGAFLVLFVITATLDAVNRLCWGIAAVVAGPSASAAGKGKGGGKAGGVLASFWGGASAPRYPVTNGKVPAEAPASALVFPGFVLSASFLISVASVAVALLSPPAIVAVEVPLYRLPKELDGFRLVQLSDLHVGPTVGATRLREVVSLTNALAPDAVLITGDVIDGDERAYAAALAPLAELRSTTGRGYVVSGNHDHYEGSYEGKVAVLTGLGLSVLNNERVSVPEGPGVDAAWWAALAQRRAQSAGTLVPGAASVGEDAGGARDGWGGRLASAPSACADLTTAARSAAQAGAVLDAASPSVVAASSACLSALGLAPAQGGNGVAPLHAVAPRDAHLSRHHSAQLGASSRKLAQAEDASPSFDLAGVTDFSASSLSGFRYAASVNRAVHGRDPTSELVLAAHQPKHLPEALASGAGLMLSGHTHGGQIFPLHGLVYLGNPLFAGLYRVTSPTSDANPALRAMSRMLSAQGPGEGGAPSGAAATKAGTVWPLWAFVSRGSVWWGPVMRLLSQREVTLIVLRAAGGAM